MPISSNIADQAPDSDAIFGAIDLGTNNCRMLAAVAAPGGFRVADAFSRVVRLGEGLVDSGRLSAPAMDRTIDALKVCAAKFARLDVAAVRAVATEACRRAANVEGFVERVKAETGITLDVISPADEARLTLAGCAPLLCDGPEKVLLFDIGGGSTEIVWAGRLNGGRTEIIEILSMPLGVVTLSEDKNHNGLTALQDAFADFDARLNIADAVNAGDVRLIGTSGTVTTLAALQLGLNHYDRAQVDGSLLSRDGIEATGRAVTRMSLDERAANACIGQDRADLVGAGISILNEILHRWPADCVMIADRGIREGLLLEMTTNAKATR